MVLPCCPPDSWVLEVAHSGKGDFSAREIIALSNLGRFFKEIGSFQQIGKMSFKVVQRFRSFY